MIIWDSRKRVRESTDGSIVGWGHSEYRKRVANARCLGDGKKGISGGSWRRKRFTRVKMSETKVLRSESCE